MSTKLYQTLACFLSRMLGEIGRSILNELATLSEGREFEARLRSPRGVLADLAG